MEPDRCGLVSNSNSFPDFLLQAEYLTLEFTPGQGPPLNTMGTTTHVLSNTLHPISVLINRGQFPATSYPLAGIRTTDAYLTYRHGQDQASVFIRSER